MTVRNIKKNVETVKFLLVILTSLLNDRFLFYLLMSDQNPVVSPCFPSENRRSSGVKSYQVYWTHWTQTDSDGKAHFSIRERLRKIPLKLDDRAEKRSDGVHRIHWTRIDSDGKVHFLFVRDLE